MTTRMEIKVQAALTNLRTYSGEITVKLDLPNFILSSKISQSYLTKPADYGRVSVLGSPNLKFISLARPKSQSSPVSADQLQITFGKRMNHVTPIPPSFDMIRMAENQAFADDIPNVTADHTAEQFFDADFTHDDIEGAKCEINKHPHRSSTGIEHIHYKDIIAMSTPLLCHYINKCMAQRECPSHG
ncbi:hypothetical protein BDP27DRAFT_1432156 [Rhodocollybia butyracea]|uniref:Uncharacterized protein n=1 Tax=Rhodocollybia butyracea TaxID=206335 RepID=A0A9P5P7S5_9AGAR|nr:hypothetical protein BDP27DRAFT_1432156 [Rhodocollybia butyracea]